MTTNSVTAARSNQGARFTRKVYGDYRVLTYGSRETWRDLVGPVGIEPTTQGL